MTDDGAGQPDASPETDLPSLRLVARTAAPVEPPISLQDARAARRRELCRHKNLLVDEQRAEVECGNCGALLNPVWVLARFMHEESQLDRRIAEFRDIYDKVQKRTRCKCVHCERMTPVRIG